MESTWSHRTCGRPAVAVEALAAPLAALSVGALVRSSPWGNLSVGAYAFAVTFSAKASTLRLS